MIPIPGGPYKPLLGKGKSVQVQKFWIDETAVTNQDFQDFLKHNPKWRKSSAKMIFVDANYLRHFKNDLQLKASVKIKSPVVNVSWFAAKAYCQWKRLRLPTVDEWEYLAQFGPADEKRDVKGIILEWYEKTTPEILPEVKSTFKNKFGVWDVHGLIWEWTQDFNTTFVTGESRGDSSLEKSMFCGSGSVGAADPSDYAAFMRFGFRSSLRASYTVGNLGFRCAKGS